MNQRERRLMWTKRVEAFNESNCNALSFCKEQNLSYASFLQWRKKLCDQQAESGFVKVDLTPESLALRCGAITLETSCSLDVDTLSSLIIALHKAASSC